MNFALTRSLASLVQYELTASQPACFESDG